MSYGNFATAVVATVTVHNPFRKFMVLQHYDNTERTVSFSVGSNLTQYPTLGEAMLRAVGAAMQYIQESDNAAT